ncbi:unnamed protein product, partial [Amoebophrya sp. A25]
KGNQRVAQDGGQHKATVRQVNQEAAPKRPLLHDEKVYEIGVHIADVTYYVAADSLCDAAAAKRTTTVYLPHKVYPMLPPRLSEDLCS